MKIYYAIRILAAKKMDDEDRRAAESAKACQLGIEALKAILRIRRDFPNVTALIPGETED